ncbi:MAG: TetR family transcriptional regulator [Actinomycetota bacterium]|jgi:AcrR family transcriptional regulator|nr:TetR family transcriptional regulator [Actinomycetota bacterium]
MPDTRAAILDAARRAFAARGYTASSLRQVASVAEVDPALVLHYFGSKRDLFAAAIGLAEGVDTLIDSLSAGPVAGLGERLVRFYLQLVDSPTSPVVALLRSAASDDEAARMVREFIGTEIIGRIIEVLEVPDAALRGTLVGTQLVGMAVLRRVVRVEPLASADHDLVVAWLAPTVQRYLTAPAPTATSNQAYRTK